MKKEREEVVDLEGSVDLKDIKVLKDLTEKREKED